MESLQIAFFCTDRGQHPRREIGPAEEQGQANEDAAALLEALGFDADELGEQRPFVHQPGRTRKTKAGDTVRSVSKSVFVEDAKGGRVWHLKCDTCKRHPRIPESKLRQIVQLVAATGDTPILDISYWRP